MEEELELLFAGVVQGRGCAEGIILSENDDGKFLPKEACLDLRIVRCAKGRWLGRVVVWWGFFSGA